MQTPHFTEEDSEPQTERWLLGSKGGPCMPKRIRKGRLSQRNRTEFIGRGEVCGKLKRLIKREEPPLSSSHCHQAGCVLIAATYSKFSRDNRNQNFSKKFLLKYWQLIKKKKIFKKYCVSQISLATNLTLELCEPKFHLFSLSPSLSLWY